MPTGLGGEKLWLSATNDNTGTSTAFNDQSGNGNNSTASSATVVADTSEGGTYAYDFDGINDYLSINDSTTMRVDNPNGIAISAWINPDTVSGGDTFGGSNPRYVFVKGDVASNFNYALRLLGGKVDFIYRDSADTEYITVREDVASLTAGSWYHIVLTGDSSGYTTYVNGTSVATTTGGTISKSPIINSNNAVVGRQGIVSTRYLDGKLDDLRLFARVITQTEVTHLATSRGIEGGLPVGLGGEKLWLCPSLNDSPNDISGNGNDGTYVGGMSTISDTSVGGTRCYSHSAVSRGITLPADLGMTADDCTIALWAYNSSVQSSTTVYQFVGAYDQTYTNSNPLLYNYSNKTVMADRTQSPNAVPQLDFENTISYATWKHLCLTKESGVYKVYLNGSLVGTSSTFTGDLSFKTTVPWAVGKGFFNSILGRTDDIRILNRAITASELTHLATSRGIQGAPQVLNYENTTNVSGVSIQSDVDVDGINLLQTDGDIQDIEIKIKWSNASSWQGCECYVIDPDGSYHYLFSSGSLPFGSGSRTDSMTISSGSFPLSMDGTWEFHLSDQMFNSNTIDEVSTDFEVIQTNMPDTYSEVSWYGGGFYRGGVDLSGNTNHVYPHNSASIVADTGSNGTNAFSFSSSSSQRWSDGIVPDYNSVPKWSVSAWIKAGQTLASKAMIFCNHGYRRGNFQLYQTGDEFGLFLGYYDPAFSFGDAEIITTTNVNITTGSWYNIIATFDGGAATQTNIYVNGASAASSRQTVASGISVLPLNTFAGTAPDQTIGAMKDAAGSTIYYPFDGEIDACRTVNSVYTSGDITWLASGRNVAGGPTDFKSYYKTNQSSITGFPNA